MEYQAVALVTDIYNDIRRNRIITPCYDLEHKATITPLLSILTTMSIKRLKYRRRNINR